MGERIIRADNMAAELGITNKQLALLCTKHALPYCELPGNVRVFLESRVLEWLQAHEKIVTQKG